MSYADEIPAPSLNIPARTRMLSTEHTFEPSFQQSVQQCVSPVPQVRRSCLKKRGKEIVQLAVKNCVSFDLEKNEVWTIKDWTLPIILERQKATTAVRLPEGWVFDGGGVVVMAESE